MRFVAIFLTFLFGAVDPSHAEKRVALVVGNSGYVHVPPLSNPVNDARLIASTLIGLGFDLVGGGAALDLEKSAFEDVLRKFADAIEGADVALFYYAGHGVQVRGSNFLIPTGANPVREADIDLMLVDAGIILRQMEFAGTKLNIVLLDACRNNPFGSRNLRSISRGLAQMQAPDGTLISYATQPGNVALDGADGNSPYTRALASTIQRPGLDIFQTFNLVGLEVKRVTRGEQQPWVSASPIAGSFYFAKTAAAAASPDTATTSKELPDVGAPGLAINSLNRGPHGLMSGPSVDRMKVLTAQKSLPTPAFTIEPPNSLLSPELRRFIGVWVSKHGYNRGGRQVMVVLSAIAPDGSASGYYAWGPPGPRAPPDRRYAAGFLPIVGTVVGNRASFDFMNGVLIAVLNSDNSLSVVSKPGDGRTLATTAEPIWQLSVAEAAINAPAKPR